MSSLCPQCNSRKSKRYCPAEGVQICTVCCGSKREVVIDCPSGCVYLQAGREHDKERKLDLSPDFSVDPRVYDEAFLEKMAPLVTLFGQVILIVREDFPEILDVDVREAFDSLIKTYETKNKGIFYDFLPNAPLARELFLALKDFIENPEGKTEGEPHNLKTDATLDCLNLMKSTLEISYFPKPKSRAYLDDLQKFFGAPPESDDESPIILA